jgi:transcriptional regulator with XRE-family HTH domain
MNIVKISDKLKALRKKFNLKQIDFANSLNVTPQAVSKWERDENYPDIFLLKKISSLFDVSIDELLGANEEKRDIFEATVFCSSLNHFAQKGQDFSAKELARWTNIVFHNVTETVLKYGGVPVKYTGDGFLCFFSGVEHADRALKASKDIDRINHDKEIVILLNTGKIYFGMVGHPEYASRDIYGDTVNKSFLTMDVFSKKIKRGVGVTQEVKKQLKAVYPFKKWTDIYVPQLKQNQEVYQLKP